MIQDRNGRICVEYRDINNKIIMGNFDEIPSNAIEARINYEYNELSFNKGSYKIILGNPVYETFDVVKTNNINMLYESEKVMLVVGRVQGLDYFIVPSGQDIIVSSREELVNTIEKIAGEFLENLDLIDYRIKKLTFM